MLKFLKIRRSHLSMSNIMLKLGELKDALKGIRRSHLSEMLLTLKRGSYDKPKLILEYKRPEV